MLLVLPTSTVEVRERLHLMKDLELHLFLDAFLKRTQRNEAAAAIVNTLKRAPDRKRGGGRKKWLEVDFSAGEIENGNRLIGLEEEENTSSDSFDEI